MWAVGMGRLTVDVDVQAGACAVRFTRSAMCALTHSAHGLAASTRGMQLWPVRSAHRPLLSQ